jgi:prepilin-type N-terminal cleavage/methylation domain-containing protein
MIPNQVFFRHNALCRIMFPAIEITSYSSFKGKIRMWSDQFLKIWYSGFFRWCCALRLKSQKGFSLIEISIAISLAGILSLVIPSALAIANKSTSISEVQTMGENLARSQMDYTQSQPYDINHNPPSYIVLSNLPAGYSLTQSSSRLNPKGDDASNDDGLQKITVTVSYADEVIYTIVDCKVNFKP